ncbi:hypothetical protein [Nocardia shimofusensis]|nr:hypothetical protein [Nocardia shimofusensis]
MSIVRPLVTIERGAPVTGTDIGLAFVIALPLAVVAAMIFWPSDYD